MRAATAAGCTEIEHGVVATDAELKLTAGKGTYLDQQAGLVWENFLRNKEKFVGPPGYLATLEGFASMEALIPIYHEFMKRAYKIPNPNIVLDLTRWPAPTGATLRSSSIACTVRAWIL